MSSRRAPPRAEPDRLAHVLTVGALASGADVGVNFEMKDGHFVFDRLKDDNAWYHSMRWALDHMKKFTPAGKTWKLSVFGTMGMRWFVVVWDADLGKYKVYVDEKKQFDGPFQKEEVVKYFSDYIDGKANMGLQARSLMMRMPMQAS